MAGDDAAPKGTVPGSSRGVVSLAGERVSRHLTERQQAEAATWQAWAVSQAADDECWEQLQRIMTPAQLAEATPYIARSREARATVLECGKRLLATDQTIADDALRVAR